MKVYRTREYATNSIIYSFHTLHKQSTLKLQIAHNNWINGFPRRFPSLKNHLISHVAVCRCVLVLVFFYQSKLSKVTKKFIDKEEFFCEPTGKSVNQSFFCSP